MDLCVCVCVCAASTKWPGRYSSEIVRSEVISQGGVFPIYEANGSLSGFMIYQTERSPRQAAINSVCFYLVLLRMLAPLVTDVIKWVVSRMGAQGAGSIYVK